MQTYGGKRTGYIGDEVWIGEALLPPGHSGCSQAVFSQVRQTHNQHPRQHSCCFENVASSYIFCVPHSPNSYLCRAFIMVGRMTWTCQFHSLKSNGVKYGVHKLIQPIMLGAQQPWPINIEWWQRDWCDRKYHCFLLDIGVIITWWYHLECKDKRTFKLMSTKLKNGKECQGEKVICCM